ncbi:hypothetical protein BC830DRAFT_1125085 [Chytriomyces sp. MP71]|nr:hypothetical protein BC830DRAFT_1125085 [Chytriomyces sp. MP71]
MRLTSRTSQTRCLVAEAVAEQDMMDPLVAAFLYRYPSLFTEYANLKRNGYVKRLQGPAGMALDTKRPDRAAAWSRIPSLLPVPASEMDVPLSPATTATTESPVRSPELESQSLRKSTALKQPSRFNPNDSGTKTPTKQECIHSCLHCGVTGTPRWRPAGKGLFKCNACHCYERMYGRKRNVGSCSVVARSKGSGSRPKLQA